MKSLAANRKVSLQGLAGNGTYNSPKPKHYLESTEWLDAGHDSGASSGIASLDRVLGGIRLGDNIVWNVPPNGEYASFVEPFVSRALENEYKVVYVKIDGALEDVIGKMAEVFDATSARSIGEFTKRVNSMIDEKGERAHYVFDCLSSLEDRYGENAVTTFFEVTCPHLFVLETVTYFSLLRGVHEGSTIARVKDITQIMIDIGSIGGDIILQPVKIWDRYEEGMFKPHVLKEGALEVVDEFDTDGYVQKLEEKIGEIKRIESKRKQAEEKLAELKKFNENIVQSLGEAIIIENADGYVTFSNPQAQDMLKYGDNLAGKHWTALVPEDYHDVVKRKWHKLSEGEHVNYESIIKSEAKGEIKVLVSSSPQFISDEFSSVISVYTDVTEIKKREGMKHVNNLKYDVKKGKTFLIKEKWLNKALDIFEDLVKNGFSGLIISRTPPADIRGRCAIDAKVLWITSEATEKEECAMPKFDVLMDAIRERIVRNSVLLLDRIDYLIMQNGFNETMIFINKVSEFMLIRNGILLLQIDDATLTEQEKSIIEKGTGHVSQMVKLPGDLLSILSYIKGQNDQGNRPSLKDVSTDIEITENTTRKRVRNLHSRGLIREVKYGRYKLIELTEEGERWF
ncbi:MAG: DUF835 domain-containing protein [Candidatus Hydrothermarchaeaceae archaeon]